MWISTLQEKFSFGFAEDFCKYWQHFHFGRKAQDKAIIL